MRHFNPLGFILLCTLCLSCAKQEVKLPLNSISGIQEPIYDNTQIWMFYSLNKEQQPELKLNDNNKISTTHWIFNIDKRLPMQLVAPALAEVVNNRKSMDDKPDKKKLFNYLSYVDTLSNSLSTLQFKNFKYRTTKAFPAFSSAKDSLAEVLQIAVKTKGIFINNTPMTATETKSFLDKQRHTPQIELYIEDQLLYGAYAEIKALLASYQGRVVETLVIND